jgi:hypothetical protein
MNYMTLFIVLLMPLALSAAEEPAGKVKYKGAKDLSFEELLVEGQLRRPELGVVTGDEDQGGQGLLKLRENFLDRLTADAGEEVR